MSDLALRFDTQSFLPPFTDSLWEFTNASETRGILAINPGGSAKISLQTQVNRDFKYIKCVNLFSGGLTSEETNYRNKPTIVTKELYKGSNNAIDYMKYRSLGFNTFTSVSGVGYRDETIFSTLDRPMHTMIVEIRNETEEVLTIYGLQLFSSIDISISQVDNAIANVSISQVVQDVYLRWDSGGNYLLGFDVGIPGSEELLTHDFNYFSGRLISIFTNYGEPLTVHNSFEQS